MDIRELFDNLPERLQDKIIRMNPHPLHKIVNDAFEKEIEYYYSYYYSDGYSYHDETNIYFENYKNAKLWAMVMETRKMIGITPSYVEYLLKNKKYHVDDESDSDSSDDEALRPRQARLNDFNDTSDDDD